MLPFYPVADCNIKCHGIFLEISTMLCLVVYSPWMAVFFQTQVGSPFSLCSIVFYYLSLLIILALLNSALTSSPGSFETMDTTIMNKQETTKAGNSS